MPEAVRLLQPKEWGIIPRKPAPPHAQNAPGGRHRPRAGDLPRDEQAVLLVHLAVRADRVGGRLRQVAVDGGRLDIEIPEIVGDPITGPLGSAEDDHPLGDPGDGRDDPVLVHVMDAEEHVVHGADGVGGRVDRHLDRFDQVAAHEMADLAVADGAEYLPDSGNTGAIRLPLTFRRR